MTLERFVKVTLFVSTTLLSPLPASAEVTTAEKATAEALFDDALRLMKTGAHADACPKLEASQRIDPAVGTLLYLGECYEKTGRTASAWVTFREAASFARASGQAQRATLAQQNADRLQPGLARITIELSSEARVIPGIRVRCGSVALDPNLSGVAIPVDSGEVLVEASAPGYAPWSRKVSIQAGGRATVSVPALTLLTGGVPTPSAPPIVEDYPVAPQPPSPGVNSVTAAPASKGQSIALPVALGAVGVVGLGLGSYFGLRAISKASDANDICPSGTCTEERGETLMQSARTSARISNVAYAVGVASLAAGLVFYLYLPTKTESKVGISPWLGEQRAGLELRGRL
jgi:hypothetical protein